VLDDDVVFYSPIVYTPRQGKEITKLYLRAGQTLPGEKSAYQRPATARSGLSLHEDRDDRRHRGARVRDDRRAK
jgi:hypothetical protein